MHVLCPYLQFSYIFLIMWYFCLKTCDITYFIQIKFYVHVIMGTCSNIQRKLLKKQKTLISIFLVPEYHGYYLYEYGVVSHAKKIVLQVWIYSDTQEFWISGSWIIQNHFFFDLLNFGFKKFLLFVLMPHWRFILCFLKRSCVDIRSNCFPIKDIWQTMKICL